MLRQFLVHSAIIAWLFGCASKSQSPSNQNPCYFMNGTDFGAYYKADEYVPCNLGSGGGGNNMCCILNPPGPNFGKPSPDVCLPNGLCLMMEWPEDAEKPFASNPRYFRNFCSDPDRTKCLDVCGDWPSELRPCGDSWNTTRWCCGGDDSCCENDSDEKLVSIPLSRIVATTSTSSEPPSVPTAGPEATVYRDIDVTVGAKIGIGIGAAVGTLALIGLGFVGGLQYMKARVNSSSRTEVKKEDIRVMIPVKKPPDSQTGPFPRLMSVASPLSGGVYKERRGSVGMRSELHG